MLSEKGLHMMIQTFSLKLLPQTERGGKQIWKLIKDTMVSDCDQLDGGEHTAAEQKFCAIYLEINL